MAGTRPTLVRRSSRRFVLVRQLSTRKCGGHSVLDRSDYLLDERRATVASRWSSLGARQHDAPTCLRASLRCGYAGAGELARYLGLVVQAWVWQLVTSPFRQRCLNGTLNVAVVRKERRVDVPIGFPLWDIGWDKESPQVVEKPT